MLRSTLITRKIKELLKNKNLTGYKLSKIIGISDGSIYTMIRGEVKFPDDKIEKIAPILGVSEDEIRAWSLASKYSQETIKRALQLQKEHAKSGEKVTVIKLRELMEANNLNVCAFATALKYDQTQLSQVRLGNASISKKLVPKLAAFSGLPEEEIQSWVVADKYPAKLLRLAVMG